MGRLSSKSWHSNAGEVTSGPQNARDLESDGGDWCKNHSRSSCLVIGTI